MCAVTAGGKRHVDVRHSELEETDIGVTVLMPVSTETDFVRRAEMLDTKIGASEEG